MTDTTFELLDEVREILSCSACDATYSDKFGRIELAIDAYRHGWRFQDGGVYCPSCADDDEQ
jgi:hypothetical protein